MAEWLNVEVANVPFMVWHESHEAVVGMWFDGLPVAETPWQVAQVPGATPIWLKPALIQVVVRWHESQEAVVMTWLAGLPVVMLPLWHCAHCPMMTPA